MRPSLSEITKNARVVKIGLRTSFRGLTEREALVFEGPNGWTEWAPFVEYEPAEAAVWLNAAIDWAYEPQPELKRRTIAINATLPAVAASEVETVLARFGTFSTVKIKVGEPGQTIIDDLARIIRVKVLYPATKIRLDANGAFKVVEALALIEALANSHVALEYFEQPCASVAELAELKQLLSAKGNSVLIAADESVRKASDPLAVAQANAADLLVLKVAPLGGVSKALEISQAAGLPVVVSSALDTSLGIAMGLHLAGSLETLDFACGLGTVALLESDLCDEPLVAQNGEIEIRRPVPSSKLLDKYQADEDHTEWWLERLEDSYAELESSS